MMWVAALFVGPMLMGALMFEAMRMCVDPDSPSLFSRGAWWGS